MAEHPQREGGGLHEGCTGWIALHNYISKVKVRFFLDLSQLATVTSHVDLNTYSAVVAEPRGGHHHGDLPGKSVDAAAEDTHDGNAERHQPQLRQGQGLLSVRDEGKIFLSSSAPQITTLH